MSWRQAASRPCRRDLPEIETRANREGANKTLLRLIQDLPDAYRGELEKRGGPFSPMEPILLARANEVLGGVRSEA